MYIFEDENEFLKGGANARSPEGSLTGFDYLAETDKTASGTFAPENVGIMEFSDALAVMIHAGQQMDKFKKALFRKRNREESGLPPLPADDPTLAALLGEDAAQFDDLFHGIVGIITETGEMAEVLYKFCVAAPQVDQTNVREEVGDVLWYMSRLVKWCETTFLTEMKRNVAKLRKRHGEAGFDKERDITRNLDAERGVLEGRQEYDAVMTAASHPPDGDGQEHGEVMRAIRGEP
jgi:NTP pyrophosphatase (non-canonical NTP hydrolase)